MFNVRSGPARTAIARHLGALVHPLAAADPQLNARHQWFIATRLGLGALGLASVPVMLAFSGSLGLVACIAVLGCATQAMAGLIASRTGRLAPAVILSIASLLAATGWIAAAQGSLTTPILAVLPILVVEATYVGGRLALAVAGGVATAVLLGLGWITGAPGGDGLAQHFSLLAAAWGLGLFALREFDLRHRQDLQIAEQNRLIAEGFGDLVTRHDPQGQVLFAGDSSSALLGVHPGALLGRGLFDRVNVSDRPAFLKAITDAAIQRRLAIATIRIACGDPDSGSAQANWFELRAQYFPQAGGVPEVVCVLRDVSARRERDEQLELARADAESANAMKSSFLATASHELRTPLNAIIGFSEMLANPALVPLDDPRRRDYARIVNVSGEHLLSVVNTLLDVSMIESGTFPIDPEPVSVADLVAGTAELMRLKADQSGIRLECGVESGLPRLLADQRACKQMLINLLGNAIKFTPSGGRISVYAARDVDGVLFSIEDTGIGIAMEDQARICEPFFQASKGRTGIEGSGLGLAVVKGLVGLHGGSMHIDSAPGRGTTVNIRLPLTMPDRRRRPSAPFLRAIDPDGSGAASDSVVSNPPRAVKKSA